MSAADFGLLDQNEEDALHLSRLLTVEERPFQRISKRLLAKDALIRKFPVQLPTPPPDATQDQEADLALEATVQSDGKDETERQKYHDDILLDFAGLEATLIRIQFLLNANERERERYAAEKCKILETADAVRANTIDLRHKLQDALEDLKLKKEYDALADLILKDKALKPREVLQSENDKLRGEIEDLEQESRDFVGHWHERRDRFNRVVEEGKSLVRYLKGEKEDDSEEEEGEARDDESIENKGDSSNVGTPRPDVGNVTPLRSDVEGEEGVLAAQQALAQRALGSTLHVPGSDTSRGSSPTRPMVAEGDGGDIEMKESASGAASDVGDTAAQSEDISKGEEIEQQIMDTT